MLYTVYKESSLILLDGLIRFMLVTQQPVFRRFWYPVIPRQQLTAEPQPFELLGEPLVIWLDSEGQPAAVRDRCCHRTAKLSLGKVDRDRICCPYHGWEFDRSGACVHLPQLKADCAIPANYRVEAYHCTERYGYIWVCLEAPLMAIPQRPEASDDSYRLIQEFYEPWQCAGLRVMENELDSAHPTFVHTETFGSEAHPTPSTDYDVPLMPSREEHMFTDRPGIMIRKKVAALLKARGETEQSYQQVSNFNVSAIPHRVPEEILS